MARRRAVSVQLVRNGVRGGHQLFAHADPAVRADGRSAVPHRPGGQGDRRHRAPDPPGARPPRGRRGRRRHGVLGDLGLDHRHHRHARQPDAAGDAGARLPPDHGHRPDHGDRRGRHADPAVGAHRSARQPFGHFDFEAADRRRRARIDSFGHVRRLHRRARQARSEARAAERAHRIPRLGEAAPVPAIRAAAGVDFRRRRRLDVRGLGHADRIGGDRRPRHGGACAGSTGALDVHKSSGAARHREQSPA